MAKAKKNNTKEENKNLIKKGNKAVEFIEEGGRVIIKRYADFKKGILFTYPMKAFWTMERAQQSANQYLNI